MSDLGDRAVGSVLYFEFTTAVNGSPITLTNSPAVEIYKGNDTTPETTGITLTANYNSVTGFHQVKVDTSTDATFYAAGSDFTVMLSAGNLGSSSGPAVAGFVIGHFSLGLGNVSNLDSAPGPTNAIPRGTVTTGGSATSVPTSALTLNGAVASGVVANQFANRTILFDGNTTTAGLRGAAAAISASSASNTPTLTVGTLPAIPASGDTFSIV